MFLFFVYSVDPADVVSVLTLLFAFPIQYQVRFQKSKKLF